MKHTDKLKRIWRRVILRDVRYRDSCKTLDKFYMVSDPWNMGSPSEQYRFAETNRVILEEIGRVGSLLEVGCGEGHQSLYLKLVCNRLTGLDVSARAVQRARKRCTSAEFLVGDIFCQEANARAPFDLVVACEVLYYMSDVRGALKRMQALGRNVFVSYFSRVTDTIDPEILCFTGAVLRNLEFEGSWWRVAWWRGDQA